jgi:hypothetical protein
MRGWQTLLLVGWGISLIGASAPGAEVFVAPGGTDTNPGTLTQPLASIVKAAQRLNPGDVCLLRAGVYRETVRPARSGTYEQPLRFEAYSNEVVTVSGTDVLTGWAAVSGGVFRVASAPAAQVFVDGQPLPRVPGGAAGANTGAAWWQDATSVWLFVRMPGNAAPASFRIEAQRRTWAFDLRGLSHIQLKGIGVFGAGVNLTKAGHCRADAGLFRYVSGDGPQEAGIVVSGRDNELNGCVIEHSGGAAIALLRDASDCRIVDCLVSYAGETTPAAPAILASGTAHTIRRNTVRDCAGEALACRALMNARVEHNDLFRCGSAGAAGGTLSVAGDGKGTVLAWNLIHDNPAAGAAGLGIEASSENYIVHHNAVWGHRGAGIRVRAPSGYSFMVHNTCALNGCGFERAGGAGGMKGTRIANNIFAGGVTPAGPGAVGTGAIYMNNYEGVAPGFVDATNMNFQLTPVSPCVDEGVAEPDFAGDFTGDAPDLGAYEFGREAWTAGRGSVDRAETVVPSTPAATDRTTNASVELPVPPAPPATGAVLRTNVD